MPDAPPFDPKDYRQPLVTSLGVFLGFLIGFVGQWVTETDFALRTASDHITFWGALTSAALLLRALYRMLLPVADPSLALAFYRSTLRLYMTGIGLAFAVLLSNVVL